MRDIGEDSSRIHDRRETRLNSKIPRREAQGVARMTETINYEITCGISARIPRVYMTDGKEAER